MKNASESCPNCGAAIPAEAPQGLCPACLLQQAAVATEPGGGAPAGAAPPAQAELAAAFPQLEILELIGQGGMGFVFKARQPKLDRLVALKILPQSLASQPAFAERFAREGRLLARLNHPNIVTIYDFGQVNGFFFLLMEFVDGVNLRQAMKAGRFTPSQALAIVPKICEALQFAHTEGILHRDIKPENILLDAKGRVKIADFGIAKLMGEPSMPGSLTGSGGALGTVHYMAPEQVEKPAQVDHRADIYSLGVVFYEMLTGELPIGRFAPPSENCAVDPRIDDVVFRTLDKKPERRPQSAGEVKTQVETIATHSPPPSPPRPAPAPQRGDRGSERGAPTAPAARRLSLGWWLGLGVAAGAGLLCVVALAVWLLRPVVAKVPTPMEAIGNAVSTNEPFARAFTFGRVTNQLAGDSGEAWAVGVWSDTPMQPGESLTACVQSDQAGITQAGCSTTVFAHNEASRGRLTTSLHWYFGRYWRDRFDEREANAAAEQLRENLTDKPLTLTAGKPQALFSVTNEAGHVLTGYVEFTRLVPKPAKFFGLRAPKPQAVLHVRSSAAFLPSLTYSVKLPPGYALEATASAGQVSTALTTAGAPNEYRSSWFIPMSFSMPSPADYRRLPAQIEAQRTLLTARFQALQDLGPIPLVLGEPFQVFCLTNSAGELYRATFELVGPSSNPTNRPAAAQSAAPRRPAMPPPLARPMPALPPKPGAAKASIDLATGLPADVVEPASATIDPATGRPAPLSRTNQAKPGPNGR